MEINRKKTAILRAFSEAKKELIQEQWQQLLTMPWKEKTMEKFHRTSLKEVIGISTIKNQIFSSLGTIGPFIFLNEFISKIELPGPYRHVEKGLLLIFSLLESKSIADMASYLPRTSFQSIHEKLFVDHIQDLSCWLKEKNTSLFSNSKLRVLGGNLMNPETFKSVTLYADGHDTAVNYNSVYHIHKFQHRDLYSFKFKAPGLRTQVLMDVNGFFIDCSKSLPCKDNADSQMIKGARFDRLMSDMDLLMLDGGYQSVAQFIADKAEEEGTDLSIDNIITPIRKRNNVPFNSSEEEYNKQFGAKRSDIETGFAMLGNTFKKLGPNGKRRISDFKMFNVQLQLGCFFMNCRKAEQFLELELPSHSADWQTLEFDFQFTNKLSDGTLELSERVEEEQEKMGAILCKQQGFISSLLELGDDNEQENRVANNEGDQELEEHQLGHVPKQTFDNELAFEIMNASYISSDSDAQEDEKEGEEENQIQSQPVAAPQIVAHQSVRGHKKRMRPKKRKEHTPNQLFRQIYRRTPSKRQVGRKLFNT